jgi:hypothetical protein
LYVRISIRSVMPVMLRLSSAVRIGPSIGQSPTSLFDTAVAAI